MWRYLKCLTQISNLNLPDLNLPQIQYSPHFDRIPIHRCPHVGLQLAQDIAIGPTHLGERRLQAEVLQHELFGLEPGSRPASWFISGCCMACTGHLGPPGHRLELPQSPALHDTDAICERIGRKCACWHQYRIPLGSPTNLCPSGIGRAQNERFVTRKPYLGQ